MFYSQIITITGCVSWAVRNFSEPFHVDFVVLALYHGSSPKPSFTKILYHRGEGSAVQRGHCKVPLARSLRLSDRCRLSLCCSQRVIFHSVPVSLPKSVRPSVKGSFLLDTRLFLSPMPAILSVEEEGKAPNYRPTGWV